MKRKKRNKLFVLILLLLGIGIGFAALSTTLKINGTANLGKNEWNIYWDENSIRVKPGSSGNTVPTVSDDGQNLDTIVTWSVNLNLPGDFYEFTIDAVNNGTLDAMITDIIDEPPVDLPNYISYTVTYADGEEIAKNQLLNASGRQKYRVRVEFTTDITNEQLEAIPDDGLSYDFAYEVQYSQADNNAVEKPSFFGEATWDEILDAYNDGEPTEILQLNMESGATKTITLDNGTLGGIQAKLRIINLSTPDECNTEGFGTTACGFVIEFTEIVTTHKMNYYDKSSYAHGNGEGSWGGWQYSDMRAYLNGYTYAKENINYAGNAFIDTFPNDLRSKIIDTKVTSSSYHGGSPSTSMVTDKIFALSPTEIWGKNSGNPNMAYDLNASHTRQLDYYAERIDTLKTDSRGSYYYGAAIKKEFDYDNQIWTEGYDQRSYWALREACANTYFDSSFYRVLADGYLSWTYSSHQHGVSPAFRIAE